MSNLKTQPLILITNDDGIDSKGLELIIEIVRNITSNYIVVAPKNNCSGYSHSITLSIWLGSRSGSSPCISI